MGVRGVLGAYMKRAYPLATLLLHLNMRRVYALGLIYLAACSDHRVRDDASDITARIQDRAGDFAHDALGSASVYEWTLRICQRLSQGCIPSMSDEGAGRSMGTGGREDLHLAALTNAGWVPDEEPQNTVTARVGACSAVILFVNCTLKGEEMSEAAAREREEDVPLILSVLPVARWNHALRLCMQE